MLSDSLSDVYFVTIMAIFKRSGSEFQSIIYIQLFVSLRVDCNDVILSGFRL